MSSGNDQDEDVQAIVSRLPAFPNYPAPLPPSLEEEPVWEGEEPPSDDDEESMTDTGEYEEVQHEAPPPSLLEATQSGSTGVIGKQGRTVYAYESKLPPEPTPLVPPDEDVDAGYDPFRSPASEAEPVAPTPLGEVKPADLSNVTDWSPVALLQAYFRAQLTRGWFARRQTMIFHRDSVAREILSTEQTYVQNLKIVLGIYMAPLQAGMNTERPLITQEEYNKLFPRLDIIIALNTELLGQLFDRITNWTNRTCVADVFLRMAAFFKMYTEYCSKYEESAAMYRHLVKTKPDFRDFLGKVENLQDIHGLDLPSFLILPCQRIPRYLMLITELNKWTWADHPDKANLEKAVEQWNIVVNHVNDSMDEATRMNELLAIEHKFNNTLNLVVPHRKFIKQGPLHKITSRIVVSPTYFLFTDIMVYGYPSGDELTVKYKGTIQLGTAWTRNLVDTDHLKNGFQIITPDKAYTMYTDTAKEKREWITAINTCINRLITIDPMLVTKRATQVKKTQRVGQQIWNLFTKIDVDAIAPASEDELIQEHVSHLNQSLAHTMTDKRALMPVRPSLEFNWTDVSSTSTSSPTTAPKSMQPSRSKIEVPKASKQEKVRSASEKIPMNPLQPEITSPQPHQAKSPIIMHEGLSREDDPNNPDSDSPIRLDHALGAEKPTRKVTSLPAQKTKVTHSKLVGDDKQYSPLLDGSRGHREYGSSPGTRRRGNQQPLHNSEAGCCSSCSIM